MADQFNVTAAYDKASYSQGETIRLTISGNYTRDVVTQAQAGPIDLPIVSASGVKQRFVFPSVPVTQVTTVVEGVTIDPSQPIIDSSPTPRAWTISADGKSITAVA